MVYATNTLRRQITYTVLQITLIKRITLYIKFTHGMLIHSVWLCFSINPSLKIDLCLSSHSITEGRTWSHPLVPGPTN